MKVLKDIIRYYTTMKEQLIMTYYIYKLECNDPLPDDQIYYGSTACLRTRKNKHKSDYNNVNSKSYNQKKYEIIRANGGWCNWNMVPIEELPNHTKLQATIREQYYIALKKSNLNSNNAYIHDRVAYQQEYYDTHREERRENDKKYYHKHKAITNCQCGGCYQHNNQGQHFKSARHMRYLSGISNEHDLAVVGPVLVTP